MSWLKRDLWKAGIALAGMLILLEFMVWVPVSAVGAQERASGLATSGMATVQVTPTEDTTVTTLNKEKLGQEVQQLKSQNDRSIAAWFWNSGGLLGSLVAALLAVAGVLWTTKVAQDKNLADRQAERTRRDDDRLQSTISGLGNEKTEAKAIAASMLLTFLQQPGYERFHQQVFNLAVANLRLRAVDPSAPVPSDSLSQALITVFKESFPLARDRLKEQDQKKEFHPKSLDAGRIHLENAFLWKADLEEIWMPWAFLRDTDLSQANLTKATLWGRGKDALHGGDFRKVMLWGAHLDGADLGGTDLSGADLSMADLTVAKVWAKLHNAKLLGAKLTEAKLCRFDDPAHLYPADLSGADLSGADLSGADLSYTNLSKARLCLARFTQPDSQVRTVETDPSEAEFKAELQMATSIPAKLRGPDLISEANLGETTLFLRAILHKANLHKANLSMAKFFGADLHEANLSGADLRQADLSGANLSGADLSEAKLSGADLSKANPEDAESLEGANLRGVKGLTKEQLEACKAKGAIIDEDPTTSSSQSNIPTPHLQKIQIVTTRLLRSLTRSRDRSPTVT